MPSDTENDSKLKVPSTERLSLKDFTTMRGSLKGRLTKFKSFTQNLEQTAIEELTSLQIKELINRMGRIESMFNEWDSIQSKIEILTSDQTQLDERDNFESQFYSMISLAQDIIERHTRLQGLDDGKEASQHSSGSSCSDHCRQLNNVKLPTINLPKFDGNYLKWLEFRDTFDSLINSNDSILEINKFHYLRSCLEGSATVVIKSIEFTTKNYKVAWDLLCERYDNKKILVNNHLKALFNIEPIVRESHRAIRFLIDHISKNLRALENLGQPTDKWDVLIIYLMSNKLDHITLKKWEEFKHNSSDLSSLHDFTKFLRNRADILETITNNRSDKFEHKPNIHKKQENDHKISSQYKNSKSFVASAKFKSMLSCPLCAEKHRITDCSDFKALSPEKRSNEALKLNLCLNCLRRGNHSIDQCRLGSCKLCTEKHNTLLHINNSGINSLPVSLSAQSASQVLLSTAMVQVINPKNNNTYLARALLDAGSQSSFITTSLKNKMNLITKNTQTCVSGINNAPINLSESCDITIQSLVNPSNYHLKCLVMPKITGHLPNHMIDVSQLNMPGNIQLADPKFYQPSDIDLLLGADIFFNILSNNQIKTGPGMPVFQETKFGWIVAGPINNCCLKNSNKTNKVHCNFTKEISEKLSQFWSLEEIPSSKQPLTLDEEFCEQHYIKNTKRLSDGRFSVMMPIRDSHEQLLGDSYKIAKQRFLNLEKKFNKNPVFKTQYSNFIKEYEELGHLTKIERPAFGYFLPHHAVIRESSETTKLRVVFDASAKTTSGKSLNDIQCIGPVVQDELFNILVRFRQHKYVITGDIIKMYRQISLHEPQRILQLILWRDDDSKPIETLQLNTVTYGTASAPFISTRCLLQLAVQNAESMVSEIIKKDFYMDDCITGAENIKDLALIHKGITETLASACFPIHKFRTNCPQIFSEGTETQALELTKEASVLGVRWNPDSDSLNFSINIEENSQKITKRIILSNTCKIFDPLGLLSACTITLKILLQKLWLLKLDWDEQVPNDIKKIWNKNITNIKSLITVSVPRCVICPSPVTVELHCFVDASQHAYAACVYLRSINVDKIVTVKLLCSKTRVAPLKPVTIPRLELCAAQLGARLAKKVCDTIRCNVSDKVFWSDSTITLSWITTQPKLLKSFVLNRVNEIRELTNRDAWRHVPTDLNPADMASRGVEPSTLVNSNLWWQGPSFLLKSESEWPQRTKQTLDLPEIKVHHTKKDNQNSIEFTRYSNAIKLQRITAYVLRFINNCKNKIKNKGPLEANELQKSLSLLIRMSQQESFSLEIDIISQGKNLKPKSNILQLSPFIDEAGVMRVGGRLENAALNYEKKHPALLDSRHHFTKILMAAEHLRLFHAGPQLLLSSFREQFWPIGGRNLARSTVRKCVICTRLKGTTMKPLLGNLPSNRVSQIYPFSTCGTDIAGPFMISSKKGRGNKISKCYLCLFVCFATKAIHLEIVSDLSTQAFIACLKRFISRRGKPHSIHCDNGKNFVGANNELGRVLRSSIRTIQDFSSNQNIKFHFNPPYSPTFGGLWEAGVKSAKHHMKRVAGNASLTFEELSTLFTQIEAILNSRPLTPLSPDPKDLFPLTPGHFLIGRPLTSLPSPPNEPRKIRTRYQLIEDFRQQFWKRWKNEFLSELQQRTKWRQRNTELKIGDLVIFKEDNLPPLMWKLGRVEHLYTGTDGVCRVADFKTHRGKERRALNKVCPLPVEDEVLKAASAASAPFKGAQNVPAAAIR